MLKTKLPIIIIIIILYKLKKKMREKRKKRKRKERRQQSNAQTGNSNSLLIAKHNSTKLTELKQEIQPNVPKNTKFRRKNQLNSVSSLFNQPLCLHKLNKRQILEFAFGKESEGERKQVASMKFIMTKERSMPMHKGRKENKRKWLTRD